jgi:hypothetical protein
LDEPFARQVVPFVPEFLPPAAWIVLEAPETGQVARRLDKRVGELRWGTDGSGNAWGAARHARLPQPLRRDPAAFRKLQPDEVVRELWSALDTNDSPVGDAIQNAHPSAGLVVNVETRCGPGYFGSAPARQLVFGHARRPSHQGWSRRHSGY